MRFDPAARSRPLWQEPVLPMLNLALLLLIFFLLAARLVPPAPFEVDPPRATVPEDGAGALTAHLEASGRLGFRGLTGPAADAALIEAAASGAAVRLVADHRAPASAVARLARRLAEAGAGPITLATEAAP